MSEKEKFDPRKHLTNLKGKMYLETRWRIVWMKDEHPDWRIGTEVLSYDPVLVKATIYDGDGVAVSTGHGGANDKGNAVWSGRGVEKAETAAIGRALGHAGFGTQFMDSDGAHLADSPVEQRQPQRPNPQPAKTNPATLAQSAGGTAEKPWKDAYTAFLSDWNAKGVVNETLLDALKVGRWGEWKGTRKEADAAVTAYLAAQPQTDAA